MLHKALALLCLLCLLAACSMPSEPQDSTPAAPRRGADRAPDQPTAIPQQATRATESATERAEVAQDVASLPVIPAIDASMKARLRAIFLNGQQRGNRAQVFAKIGDSITESLSFLTDLACGLEDLDQHSDLDEVIDYFGAATLSQPSPVWCELSNSFSRASVSAVQGWDAGNALAPLEPPHPDCPPPDHTALRCELRLIRPAIALIMYGTNDLERHNDLALYRAGLEAIVQQSVDAGVIPVLSTIPPRLDGFGSRVAAYNQVVAEVAHAQQVPLWNYWRALQGPDMVNSGLGSDGVHPSLYGGCRPDCLALSFSQEGLRYGYNQRNLTALQVLATLKAIVLDDGAPAGLAWDLGVEEG